MRLRVLGPIELSDADGPIFLARRQQRLILGILAVEATRVVSCDRLIELVWGGHPPRQARAVIQTRVSELRAILAGHLDGQQGLFTRSDGYVLAIEPELVDLHEFRMLVERARNADSDEQTRELLRRALGLWHGPVLGGWLPAYSHAALCGSVEALRLTAAEHLFGVELKLGHHHSAVDEISELAAANPARERLTALAMTALHRAGRTAEALQIFDRCRRWLADELGVDPGIELQEFYLAILRGDTELTHDADAGDRQATTGRGLEARQEHPASEGFSIAAPHLLPVDIPDFTGRTDELARLRELVTGLEGGVRLAIVSGPAGVGKTTLSVHVAHQLRDQFPHGQLYVDLHGADRPESLTPKEVLARFLRALGVESPMPDTVDERAELYRDIVAGRNILVMLDNARDADQVRPLIPGSSTCAVVITSRTRLAAAVGGNAVDLDVLTEPQAIDLMSRITGSERIRSEPPAAAGLVSLCGGLPLAVRIAAARLVAKPHWSVNQLVDRLLDERRRLDQLSYGDLDVRAASGLPDLVAGGDGPDRAAVPAGGGFLRPGRPDPGDAPGEGSTQGRRDAPGAANPTRARPCATSTTTTSSGLTRPNTWASSSTTCSSPTSGNWPGCAGPPRRRWSRRWQQSTSPP
jgi:DNA-binding SARP family transcriptional activator